MNKPISQPPLIIFTDLDGSLLDHHNYSHLPAEKTLRLLDSLGVPVIFNTSKTFAEQLELRKSTENNHPFIVENGAGIYIPKSVFDQAADSMVDAGDFWLKEFCPPRSHWQTIIEEASLEFSKDFKTFSQASAEEIMEWTDLPEDKVQLARQRQYGEPVRWFGTESRRLQFIESLESLGAHVLQGGRFIHVSGPSDKGRVMSWLASLYKEKTRNDQIRTLAIGDSGNDVAMLEAADYALVIKSPVNPAPKLHRKDSETDVLNKTLIYSKAYGPEGWAEGVEQILKQMNMS